MWSEPENTKGRTKPGMENELEQADKATSNDYMAEIENWFQFYIAT
jgi:hypothetical protein